MARSSGTRSDRAVGTPTRTYVLGAVALILLAGVAFQQYGGTMLPGMSETASDGAQRHRLVTRIERLSRFVNAADRIDQRYGDNAFAYAQEVADLRTLVTDQESMPAEIAKRTVQDVIGRGEVSNPSIQVGTPNPRGAGVHEVLVSVAFTTPSSRHATGVVRTLGNPDGGSAWQSFSLTADRDKETVRVSGDLKMLVIESAE